MSLPASVQTWLSCWCKVDMHSDVLIFHNFRRPSPPDVIICIPRDKNSPLKTEDSCPSNVYDKNKSNWITIRSMSIKKGNLFFLLITFRQLSSVKDHSFIVQSADVVKST